MLAAYDHGAGGVAVLEVAKPARPVRRIVGLAPRPPELNPVLYTLDSVFRHPLVR
ncbi:hypothetical protein [Occultella kanbiaonis]|uniref:hypothetical protein n=1 Tax=Occultella kanbiaonis TaxID=2675754 RepID=UPI0012B7C4CC|nr:hypothetical protein [Occultella kanbiaonis]